MVFPFRTERSLEKENFSMRNVLPGVFCVAVLAAPGIANGASLSNADKQFATMAAKIDMTEAHIGQLAENQATRADVKGLAKTLVQEDTESYQHLAELAAKAGVSIPKGIDAAKNPTIQRLVHLKGDRFDREFAREEIAADRRALGMFKREVSHGQDADLKDYANKMVPNLQKQLRLAEECTKPARHS
jgi:putative membrane protein